MSQPFQHAPIRLGGPCARCGLVYSQKTAYIPCFEPGDTLETWTNRNRLALALPPPFEQNKKRDSNL